MKKLLLIIASVMIVLAGNTQNVGIGTTSPEVSLDVNSPISQAAKFNSNASQMWLGIYEHNSMRGYLGSVAGNTADFDIGTGFGSTGKLLLTISGAPKMTIDNTGNIGIGTMTPSYKLDVAGRMRMQHSGTSTAGIFFDGTTLPNRSFIGTINDDHVGIYGNGGAGWNFAMNVENGNTGIGTDAPTAKLDVNGDIRIRGSVPKKGSILSSIDANGNASWADPVAFKAVGGLNNQPTTVQHITWTKVFFNQVPHHNLGLNYQPLLSQFLVAEYGIYHFDASLQWDKTLYQSGIKLMINRGGAIFTVAEYFKEMEWSESYATYSKAMSTISTDVNLYPGDLIWVEGFAYIHESAGTTTTISTNGARTFFSGHLVARY